MELNKNTVSRISKGGNNLMKTFFIIFLIAITSSWTQNLPDFTPIQDLNTLEIKTPGLLCRKTEKIKLNNGQKVYLISDPKATQSAAALAMHVGSWSDTPNYPGIAHFLEHLLFMGSETYPEENGYERQIIENGGTFNAYTASDRTVYIFAVNHDAFLLSADMFAHMLINPLFRPSGVAREQHAVDQEHDKNMEDDGDRIWMVIKETGNPSHPNAIFNTGNSKTLENIPQEEVKKWFQTHYSADKAHIVLYSPLPLEELRHIAIHSFSALPLAKDTPRLELNQKLFSKSQESHIITIEPIQDLRDLALAWELPKEYMLDLENQPHYPISYILGGQYQSSLYATLKEEGLIEEIDSDILTPAKDCGIFILNLALTPKGVSQCETVIMRCFQMLNSLKTTEIPSYIFDEIATMAHTNYAYQLRTTPYNFVMQHAHDMIDEPFSTFPQKTSVPPQSNSTQFSQFLTYLRPENCVYLLVAPTSLTNSVPDKQERWSGVQYSTKKIPLETLNAWDAARPHPHISLPKRNHFIPEDLQLLTQKTEEQPENAPTPILLSDCDQGKVYFWQDTQAPTISWIFNIHTPLLDGSSTNAALMDLYQHAWNKKIADTLFYANAASLSAYTEARDLKFILSISGYSEKALPFLETLLSHIKSLQITEKEFDQYKTSLHTTYSNMDKAMPFEQAQEIMQNVMTNIHPTQSEKAAALKKISYNDFLFFKDNIFHTGYIEAILGGNMREEDGAHVWNTVRNILAYHPYPVEKQKKKQLLTLSPPIEGPYKIHATTESLGNAAILVLQEGPFSFFKKAATAVLGIALREDAFDNLRTKQQTAYIVKVFNEEEGEQFHKLFMVQSSTHQPDELISRIELLLENYAKDFESILHKERFELIRNNLVTLFTTPPVNLSDMVQYLNTIAFTYKGDFQRRNKMVEALKNLSYEKVKKYAFTALSRRNSKRLAIMLEGKQPEEKKFRYKEISVENLKNEGTYITSP